MAEPEEEAIWVEKSQHGDGEAFGNLVARYQRQVHALTFRMSGSAHDAEDLAQETFVRAFRQLAGFRREARFMSWLYRIAMNTCLNWQSCRQRRQAAHRDWANEAGVEPPEPGRLEFVYDQVQAALERLHPKQRAAVVLTVYEGLSHADAAGVLGCSETTVSWRLFAARRKLKRWLAPFRPIKVPSGSPEALETPHSRR